MTKAMALLAENRITASDVCALHARRMRLDMP
jgi:hypothetical protein